MKLPTYGLLRNSFRSSQEIRTMRTYWQQRNDLIPAAVSHIQRIQKALTEVNIQLANVLSDVSGVTGEAILKAILAGERDPHKLAALRDPRVKASEEQIARYLEGNWVENLIGAGHRAAAFGSPHCAGTCWREWRTVFQAAFRPRPYKQYLAEEPQAALEAVARGTRDIPLTVGKARLGGKRRILGKIQAAFETAGIWQMMQKNIPAEQYTYPGDPLKIDVAYRSNGVIKMLQALSLEANVDAAKALAFSYPQLVRGIAGHERAETFLTAVVDDDLPRANPGIDFALGALERTGITVAVEMPLIAEKARQELRA